MKDEKDGVMEAGDQPKRLKTQPIYPPRDSAVLLEPRGFRLDARIQARWLELAREYRTWRGAILAASFQLEYVLDQVIAEYFFPGVQRAIPDSDSDRQALAESTVLKETFEQSFLRSGLMLMGRKRELVVHLLGGTKLFGHVLSEELKAGLRTANETRNLFAHGPVYFRSRGEAPDEDFMAVLIGSKGAEKELSPEICQTFKAQILDVCGELAALRTALSQDIHRVDPGELVALRSLVWGMHVGLDTDDWQVADAANPLNMNDILIESTRADAKLHVRLEAASDEEQAKTDNEKGRADSTSPE